MKKIFFSTVLLFVFSMVMGQSTVSTFHCISLYWSPIGGATNNNVLVQYSIAGSNDWKDGYPMKYQPIAGCGINPKTNERYDKADYRGSIVDLTPGTVYDIQLTLAGIGTTVMVQASTWEETFPVSQTIVVGNRTTRYDVPTSGTANGYLVIDGTGSTIDIQDGSPQCIRLIDKSYVIIRGFTLNNAGSNALRMFNCHHIVIEDCDISGWGEEDVAGTGFGKGYQSGIYAGSDDAAHVVIQRNKIHHPRWDTNSWAELHDPNADPNNNSNYHPDGPQAIGLGQCNIGNNVIRYNEMWSDDTHYFNDVIGLWSNASYAGFPGPDSDIYGNFVANCWDDGIESEGCNTNVRIFANYIEENLIPIANAATSIGPLYIWKNISGRSYSLPGSVYGEYGPFLKLGYANNVSWMTGQIYVFNNTILQPSGEGAGGLGTVNGSNRHIKHLVSRNNILQVKNTTTNSISTRATNNDIDYDYDLLNKGYPGGHEGNGFGNAIPIYDGPAPTINYVTKIGDFRLDSSSPGFDDGEIITNFKEDYLGNAPDIGAHEAGSEPMIFGVNSIYPLALVPLAVDLFGFLGENEGRYNRLYWSTAVVSNASHFQLEHSVNSFHWTSIGNPIFIDNNKDEGAYSQRHIFAQRDNYYRLKMVDSDGNFKYSNIVFLANDIDGFFISPNPANERIVVNANYRGTPFVIVNSIGVVVLRQIYNGQYIDILDFPNGSYFLRMGKEDSKLFVIKR